MSKARRGTKANPVTMQEFSDAVLGIIEKPFLIRDAVIKDDFCNYGYEIVKGIGVGDKHNVKGNGIIMDDMRSAFAQFNVHLACIDDVFKHSGRETTDIDALRNDDLTFLYTTTGFKIKGSKDDESIVLIGNKYVSSAGGRIELETPKIPLDNASSYQWYNELKAAADEAREEVELYKNGKCTPVEPEEEKPDPKQAKMSFTISSPGDGEDNLTDILKDKQDDPIDDFETGKV